MLYSLSCPCFRKFKVFWKAMKEGRHGPSFEMGAVLIRSSGSRCWDVIRITRGLLHKRRENSVEDRRFTGMALDITNGQPNGGSMEQTCSIRWVLYWTEIFRTTPCCLWLQLSRKSTTAVWTMKQFLKMFIARSCWLISLLAIQSQIFSWKEI